MLFFNEKKIWFAVYLYILACSEHDATIFRKCPPFAVVEINVVRLQLNTVLTLCGVNTAFNYNLTAFISTTVTKKIVITQV